MGLAQVPNLLVHVGFGIEREPSHREAWLPRSVAGAEALVDAGLNNALQLVSLCPFSAF
jgi:hypothetical protein